MKKLMMLFFVLLVSTFAFGQDDVLEEVKEEVIHVFKLELVLKGKRAIDLYDAGFARSRSRLSTESKDEWRKNVMTEKMREYVFGVINAQAKYEDDSKNRNFNNILTRDSVVIN